MCCMHRQVTRRQTGSCLQCPWQIVPESCGLIVVKCHMYVSAPGDLMDSYYWTLAVVFHNTAELEPY